MKATKMFSPATLMFLGAIILLTVLSSYSSSKGTDFSPFDRRFHLIMNVAVGGAWPASAWYSVAPRLYRSLRGPVWPGRTPYCSGGAYSGVPIPRSAVRVRGSFGSHNFTSPKSTNTAFPSGVMTTFCGFTSR